MAYMLDTNIVSDAVRNPSGVAARKIGSVGVGRLCVSIIVAAEVRFDVLKKKSPVLSGKD